MSPSSEMKKRGGEEFLAASPEAGTMAEDMMAARRTAQGKPPGKTQRRTEDEPKSAKQSEMCRKTEEQGPCACCSSRRKQRSDREYKDLIHRLNRIEGQVRGICGMVENDAYCVDILTQVAAVTAALNSFNKVLLANHINTCVAEDIRAGKEGAVEELVTTLQKLMK